MGDCEVVRESETTVEIRLTARYKPGEARPEEAPRTGTGNARGSDDEDTHETDQWGYTETEFLPALRITDLTETEADLVAAFVPVAVDEAGGFAGFRETATKTNSLVDRLRKLTLPAVADVREGLASYRETKARADELEEKIERTDELKNPSHEFRGRVSARRTRRSDIRARAPEPCYRVSQAKDQFGEHTSDEVLLR